MQGKRLGTSWHLNSTQEEVWDLNERSATVVVLSCHIWFACHCEDIVTTRRNQMYPCQSFDLLICIRCLVMLWQVKATFSFHKIITKKHTPMPTYILISHFTWILEWFIILDMNNLVKVSHHYWILLKLSMKSKWAAKWGAPFSNQGGTTGYS